VVGSGPYYLTTYDPGRLVVLDRNPNWNPATDPLRKAWVDRIQVKLGVTIASIQRAIDRGEADLSLTSHVPQSQLAALRADPAAVPAAGGQHDGVPMVPGPWDQPQSGAIADVRVRQAVNYAIDKVAYRDAIANKYAPNGDLASTILAPSSLGYRPYDLYPSPGGRDAPAKARALLAEAGYPKGLTLSFATLGSVRFAAAKSRSSSPWRAPGST